ncbi:hypothetical protein ACFXJ8_26035 [Nonomuraea sp. NPDC059194]|uniref:hypothetical protein n=1 Tax=Nonomuraea sp. NPDC059194 TaxID=3346764 RepID=UPI0036B337D6
MTVHGRYTGLVREDLGWLSSGASRPSQDAVFHRANLPRAPLGDQAALTSGVMTSVPLYLSAGDLVTNLTFISGGTAAATPTNYWFALYSTASTPALLAQTADQLTAAWAADTAKTLALASAYRVVTSGIYWAAVMVAAGTPPTLMGAMGAKPVLSGENNLAVTSGSSLTTTAPATIATPAFKRTIPLVIAS